MDIDFGAIVQVFLAEAMENLTAMEDALLALEARPGDEELLYTVFRVAHTLKGDAANLGFGHVAAFAHGVEDLLDRMRERAGPAAPGEIGLLLEAVDALREMIPAATAGEEELTAEQTALAARFHQASSAAPEPTSPVFAAAASAPVVPPEARAAAPEAPPRARTLRVDVDKLDRTLNLVGEIAIARGRLSQMLDEGRTHADLVEAHREADRLHMELQETVMKLRMVPLGPTFRPYVRTVRDVAAGAGKQVRVTVQGEDVEVDTSVVEHLRDPLTHMVRNAVDHGVETPDARRAAGKDPCGTVTLSARHEGGTIAIRMSDDGAGLDRERILARARERGLVADGDRLSDAEVFRLVFEPGFSTAAAVTELSGRGVGLDVVRRTADALRGSVLVESTPGEGTTITLRLPLTLAIIEGFSVGAAGETYVLPLDQVTECVEFPADEAAARQGSGILSLRGEPLPYVRLTHLFSLPEGGARRQSVVVVDHGARRVGLVVDELLGEGQAVIKPLGKVFRDLPGISGSTILGNGRVALIVDMAAAAAAAGLEHSAAPA